MSSGGNPTLLHTGCVQDTNVIWLNYRLFQSYLTGTADPWMFLVHLLIDSIKIKMHWQPFFWGQIQIRLSKYSNRNAPNDEKIDLIFHDGDFLWWYSKWVFTYTAMLLDWLIRSWHWFQSLTSERNKTNVTFALPFYNLSESTRNTVCSMLIVHDFLF